MDSNQIMTLKGRLNTKESQELTEESKLSNNNEQHDIGCPRYRLQAKAKRTAKSPQRSPSKLHPKPWGARDPKEIPCSCTSSRKVTIKSAPPSRRQSPVREPEISMSAKGRISRRRNPSNGRKRGRTPREEVLSIFDEFCEKASKIDAKLSLMDLQNMIRKINRTFLNVNDIVKETNNKESLKEDNSVTAVDQEEVKYLNEATSQHSLDTQPSVIELKASPEPSDMVWEVSGPPFSDHTIAFSNLIGSVTLGNSSFFPLDAVFQPPMHRDTLVTFENTQAFLPSPPSPPRRMPRSPNSRSPTRRHF